MKAIIIGGGIGGLTTALMLHARGIDCEVFEQAEAVRELGVGINTLPHAIKELAGLGLLERLDAVAIRTHELYLHEPLRPGDLARAARARGRLRRAAVLDPSRPPAGRDPSGGARPASAKAASTPATGSAPSGRTKAASPPISSTATDRTARPRAATC